MLELPAYLAHISSPETLITPREVVRSTFISVALEKNRRATPYVESARALRDAARNAQTPMDLLSIPNIEAGMLTAAGLSAKALKHLNEADRHTAISEFIRLYLDPTGPHFVDELIYRYLLTSGDALGGSIRNIVGGLATDRFIRSLIANLTVAGHPYSWQTARNKLWQTGQPDFVAPSDSLRALHWQAHNSQPRTLVLNATLPEVDSKNIDLCLINLPAHDADNRAVRTKSNFVALGELKGGIDPAGSDEHWKTANTALGRIREAFTDQPSPPHIFFVGAAIVNSVAADIWQQLLNRQLAHAANLYEDSQLNALTRWLISL